MKERILVAGIGNIFLGDDAFGVEVVRRLAGKVPDSVRVADFGIRGFDLAYALMDGYEAIILVDATARHGTPGTLYTIEPDLGNCELPITETLDPHSLNPATVLALVRTMGGKLNRVLVVGCEPASLGNEQEGYLGLSAPVGAAVGEAVSMIQDLIEKILAEMPAESGLAKAPSFVIEEIQTGGSK